MEHLLNKLKHLSRTDFKKFKVFENTKNRLIQSSSELDDVIRASSKIGQPTEDFIQIILFQFYEEDTRENFFSNISTVKKLCWVLDYKDELFNQSIVDNGLLTVALELIDRNFSTVMYFSLLNTLFSNWSDLRFERLRKYIIKKLHSDTNQRSKIIYLKSIIQFISTPKGPENWALEVSKNEEVDPNIFFSNHIFLDHLKNKEYFQIFFISLYEHLVRENSFEDRWKWRNILEFSKINFVPSITKYFISLEIYHYENDVFGTNNQDLLKNLAIELIGDPQNKSQWIISHIYINQDRKEIIEAARKILTKWVNATLINLFFSRVVDDYDRRIFWVDYINDMERVDIFLNSYLFQSIIKDPAVKGGLEDRFGIMKNGGTTSSVLIFDISKFRFVLSGSTAGGALYVHPIGSVYFPNVENLPLANFGLGKKYRVISKTDLVHSHIQNLMSHDSDYNYSQNDEGRMVHSGYWKFYLGKWMNNKIKSNVGN
ncbi:EH signature domain-containing protein [Peijinzhouia sedimentorum]